METPNHSTTKPITRRLRKKIEGLKQELILANLKINDLEKENLTLRTISSDLKEQLSSLAIKLELQERGSTPAIRSSSFPFSSNSLLALPQQNHDKLSSSQSMAGSTDESTQNGAHNAVDFSVPPLSPASSSDSPSSSPNSIDLGSAPPLESSSLPFTPLVPVLELETSSSSSMAPFPSVSPSGARPSLPSSYPNHVNMASSHLEAERLRSLLVRLRKGEKVEEDDLVVLATQYFDSNPTVLDYLASQSSTIIPTDPIQTNTSSTRSNSVPMRGFVPLRLGDCNLVGFLEPFSPSCFSCLHASPFPYFSEQASKIRLLNTTSENLHVTVHTFASNGCFLGFTLSRSSLRPNEDTRLSLSLVGTSKSEQFALAFAVLTVYSISNASPSVRDSTPSSSASGRTQYFCFGSCVQLTPPSPEESAWKVRLTRLIENMSFPLLSAPTSTVYAANLLGAQLTSRMFKRHASLGDLLAFQRLVALASSLQHPNIASIIGVSDKRPFRIISQNWTCTLTTALAATYVTKIGRLYSRQASSPRSIKMVDDPNSPVLHFLRKHGRESILAVDPATMKGVPILDDLKSRLLIALDVLAGISALHLSGRIHRDLSTESIGLASPTYALLVELASVVESSANTSSTPVLHTHRWLSPEISSNGAIASFSFSIATDIFAFGAILLDLIVGAPVSMALAVPQGPSFDTVFSIWIDALSKRSPIPSEPSPNHDDGETPYDNDETTHFMRLSNLVHMCCFQRHGVKPSISTIEQEISAVVELL